MNPTKPLHWEFRVEKPRNCATSDGLMLDALGSGLPPVALFCRCPAPTRDCPADRLLRKPRRRHSDKFSVGTRAHDAEVGACAPYLLTSPHAAVNHHASDLVLDTVGANLFSSCLRSFGSEADRLPGQRHWSRIMNHLREKFQGRLPTCFAARNQSI